MNPLETPAIIEPELAENICSEFLVVRTAHRGGSDVDSMLTFAGTAELTDGASALTVDPGEIASTKVLDAPVAIAVGPDNLLCQETQESVMSIVSQVGGDQFVSLNVPTLAHEAGYTSSLPRAETDASDDSSFDLQPRGPQRRTVAVAKGTSHRPHPSQDHHGSGCGCIIC